MYLTLDSIDGKQARRSKVSSPLGQLFDHGSDSINVVFIGLTVCYALNASPLQIFMAISSVQGLGLVINWM